MSITDEAKDDLGNACELAANMRGHIVREQEPVIRIDDTGRVVVVVKDPAEIDAWVTLCAPRTKTGVTTDSRACTITFRP